MTGVGSGVEVRLLGPIEACRDGESLPLGGGLQQTLLAVLALRPGEVVSSDRLIDELWGERPPETAATSLHGLVSQLRKAIEPDRGQPTVLVTRAPGYVLEIEPDAIDAVRFERLLAAGAAALERGEPRESRRLLEEALALWRGAALASVADQPFARSEAHRLDELRLHAQEERIEAELALGRAAAVVPALEALIEREPLRERPRGQLMRALYADGRQAEALQVYRAARRTLHDELGIEPGPELRELERQILAQDPSLASPPARPFLEPARRRRRALGIVMAGATAATVVAGAVAAVLLARDGRPPPLVPQPNSVAVIDPASNRIVAWIPVGARPTAVAVGHGSVWIANTEDGTVMRIDPETRTVVNTVGIGAPASSLAVSADAVWVGNGSSGTVSRIDPRSNAVDTIDVSSRPGDIVKDTVYGVAVTRGSVWVGVGRAVLRLDSRTGARLSRIELGAVPLALASGEAALWVAAGNERLLRIEPAANRVTIDADIAFPTDVAAGLGRVWVTQGNVNRAALGVFDGASLAPRGLFQLGEGLPSNVFPTAVAVMPGACWVAEARYDESSRILRFAADRLEQEPAELRVGPEPTDLAVGAGVVWVTLRRPGP